MTRDYPFQGRPPGHVTIVWRTRLLFHTTTTYLTTSFFCHQCFPIHEPMPNNVTPSFVPAHNSNIPSCPSICMRLRSKRPSGITITTITLYVMQRITTLVRLLGLKVLSFLVATQPMRSPLYLRTRNAYLHPHLVQALTLGSGSGFSDSRARSTLFLINILRSRLVVHI